MTPTSPPSSTRVTYRPPTAEGIKRPIKRFSLLFFLFFFVCVSQKGTQGIKDSPCERNSVAMHYKLASQLLSVIFLAPQLKQTDTGWKLGYILGAFSCDCDCFSIIMFQEVFRCFVVMLRQRNTLKSRKHSAACFQTVTLLW